MDAPSSTYDFRSVWISDLHLGNRNAKVSLAISFLENLECEILYLVGDIFDFECIGSKWHWNQNCLTLLDTILKLQSRGTRVIYITGNHDHQFRSHIGRKVFDIEIVNECIHTSKSGNRLLVIHGDAFESDARLHNALETYGAHLYDTLMFIDRMLGYVRNFAGLQHWSLAGAVKRRSKTNLRFLNRFGQKATNYARATDCTGVVCGHVHYPEIRQFGGTFYYNTGDWVESCSALTEDTQGRLCLVDWKGKQLDSSSRECAAVCIAAEPQL